MKRILCLWIPNWPVQRLLNAKPTLPERGLVLSVLKPGRGLFVFACDQRAELLGVRRGMPVSEALSLPKRKQDQLLVEPYDAGADRLALDELALRCEKFSPLVGMEEAVAPDCLLLDMTGLEHLFQSEQRLARQVIGQFQVWNYYTRVAIANTLGAAWGSARYVATSRAPAILPADEAELLSRLPVEGLRLSSTTIDLLHQLGIYETGEVLAIERSSLKARFGPDLLLRLDQFTGRADELIVPCRQRPEFSENWCFDYPTTDTKTIEHVIQQLLQRLTAALRQQKQGVLELECLLQLETTGSICLTMGLYEASVDERHLWELIDLQLESQRLPAPVGGIIAQAKQTAPLAWRQSELFAGHQLNGDQRDNSRQLAALVDRLSSRLGRERVVRPRLQPDAVPERAVFDQPLAGLQQKNKSRATSRFAPFERPLCLLPEPVLIQVIAMIADGPPKVFFYHNQRHQISHYWGPERIESAWWRGPSVRRDYYRVETVTGQRYWLFRCLRELQWFLHGEFS